MTCYKPEIKMKTPPLYPPIGGNIYMMILLLITSCLRVERIEEMNTRPVLKINGQEEMVVDSVKMKGGFINYDFELSVIDPDHNLESISYDVLAGDGSMLQNGLTIHEIQIEGGQNVPLIYRPSRVGNHVMRFSAMDTFKQETSITLDLYAFENMLPIAQFELVEPVVKHDPLEYQIDALQSYDPDKKYGGGISSYEYTFLGKIIELTENQIGIIFPETGTYDIGLRVKDNDGEWSQNKIKSFRID